MTRSCAPWLWSPRSGYRWTDPFEGFGDLGLGNPTTLWFAKDQPSGLSTFVTRKGYAWSKNEQDGGTLSLSSTTWGVNSLPTVNLIGSGANVRVGLRCDEFAPNSTSHFNYTISGPCYYPSSFAAQIVEAGFNGGGADNNPYWNFWNAVTPGLILQQNGVNVILASWTGPNASNNPTVQRRGIFVITGRVNAGVLQIQFKIRTSAGLYTTVPKSTLTNGGSYSRFAMGYNPRISSNVGAASSALGFGGGVGWSVGASAAQMDTVIDKWQSIYPLS
jgi:hypothetical protein